MGDRVIEIGCIELLSRNVTERQFHTFLNPEREIDEGAAKVHGLTLEFLADKPKFADIARDFVEYISGAELIIHNAAFDVEFLDQELSFAGLGKLTEYAASVVDTLAMARELHPGKRNGLDALCERFSIDNAHRTLHGALLDAQLLAEAYLAMTRGQESLTIDMAAPTLAAILHETEGGATARLQVAVLEPSAEEIAAHRDYLAALYTETSGRCLWLLLEPISDAMAA